MKNYLKNKDNYLKVIDLFIIKMESQESNWISEHQEIIDEYSGRWVAILKDKLVAAGNSIEEVRKILKKKDIKELPLITKIPRQDEELSIL